MPNEVKRGYGYGKRPLWQWVILYAVIALVVYGLVYYFVFARSGNGYNYGTQNPNPPSQQQKTGY